MSYLTQSEKLRLQLEWPDSSETLGYADVSHGMLSIARYSMGAVVGGHRFDYIPEHDELWRADVLKLVQKWRKDEAKAAKVEPPQTQGELL